jgi:hypothetical protein
MTAVEGAPTPLRTGVRVAAVVLALLLVGWGALTLASLVLRDHDSVSEVFDGVTAVSVDAGFESVQIVGSAGNPTVTMDRTANWSLHEPSRTATVRDGQLSITSDCWFSAGRGCGGRLRIVVPADLPVTVSTGDGDLTLTDLSGPVTATTGDGAIRARGLTGTLTAHTSDGGISGVGLGSAKVTGTSGDGSVDLAFDQAPDTVTIRSGDGGVAIAVPDDGGTYQVTAAAADNVATVTVPTDQQSDRRIDVHTGDGRIRITPAS